MIVAFIFAAAAVAVPQVPPPQRSEAAGGIDSRFGGPSFPFPYEGVAGAKLICSAKSKLGKVIALSATINPIPSYQSLSAAPPGNPHPWIEIKPNLSHDFAGSYESTFSNTMAAHYGIVSRLDSVIYYIGFSTYGYKSPVKLEISIAGNDELEPYASGTCRRIVAPKKVRRK